MTDAKQSEASDGAEELAAWLLDCGDDVHRMADMIRERDAQVRADALAGSVSDAKELAHLRGIILHVNNCLAGADQDTEHQIEGHADALPGYTRDLAHAIEVAHGPVNDWISARIWKEQPPPLPCKDPGNDCTCIDDATLLPVATREPPPR